MTGKFMRNKPNGMNVRPISSLVVANNVLGFRESAELMKVASDCGCTIRLASGDKNGSTESVLSLISMGLTGGKTVFLSVEGNDEASAIKGCARVLHAKRPLV